MSQQPDASEAAIGDDVVDVTIERFVAGGVGLGHVPDGRVILVEGGLPGDGLRVRLTSVKKRMVTGVIESVVAGGPARISPPCPELAFGCGGCDLQHADSSSQPDLKVEVVRDALRRIARLESVPVIAGEPLRPFGYRTILRCSVDPDSGRLGFRRRRSHRTHVVDDCMIAHPYAADLIRQTRFPGVEEVTIKVGAATGDRMISARSAPRDFDVPEGVIVAVNGSHGAAIHEVVADRRFRISAGSFFQARPDGATALVDATRRALGTFDARADRLVDLYGGVGLFTAALGAQNAELVELSRSATEDARANLFDLGTVITRSDVSDWKPTTADVVIADPPRSGLGRIGVSAIVATGARAVGLISCDPASMARDVALLVDADYLVTGVEVIDMFPQTHHIETVTGLRKRPT